jgi:hypothetical protein
VHRQQPSVQQLQLRARQHNRRRRRLECGAVRVRRRAGRAAPAQHRELSPQQSCAPPQPPHSRRRRSTGQCAGGPMRRWQRTRRVSAAEKRRGPGVPSRGGRTVARPGRCGSVVWHQRLGRPRGRCGRASADALAGAEDVGGGRRAVPGARRRSCRSVPGGGGGGEEEGAGVRGGRTAARPGRCCSANRRRRWPRSRCGRCFGRRRQRRKGRRRCMLQPDDPQGMRRRDDRAPPRAAEAPAAWGGTLAARVGGRNPGAFSPSTFQE